jgi:hypothetical protein
MWTARTSQPVVLGKGCCRVFDLTAEHASPTAIGHFGEVREQTVVALVAARVVAESAAETDGSTAADPRR